VQDRKNEWREAQLTSPHALLQVLWPWHGKISHKTHRIIVRTFHKCRRHHWSSVCIALVYLLCVLPESPPSRHGLTDNKLLYVTGRHPSYSFTQFSNRLVAHETEIILCSPPPGCHITRARRASVCLSIRPSVLCQLLTRTLNIVQRSKF